MNTTQLQSRAARLLARLNAMGFTKAGKPMVIDQAFELVAAEEGYRNQHALRARLSKGTGFDAAVEIFARGAAAAGYCQTASAPEAVGLAEDAGRLQWHAACNRAGWNDESQILQLEGFIAQKGLMAEFGAYAHAAALEEGAVGATLTQHVKRLVSDAQIAFLRAVGYDVCQSEYKRPYWELDLELDDAASEDFETPDEAWADAWRDAVKRGFIAAGDADSPMKLQTATLEAQWGAEHGYYDREDWGQSVALRNTRLGYWEWVAHCIESNGGEGEHCEDCGIPLEGNERVGAKCGRCADEATAPRATDIAQEAYEAFDFQAVLGSNSVVAAQNGWEYTSGLPEVVCTVFVGDMTTPDAPTRKVRFAVDVIDGVASNPRVSL